MALQTFSINAMLMILFWPSKMRSNMSIKPLLFQSFEPDIKVGWRQNQLSKHNDITWCIMFLKGI